LKIIGKSSKIIRKSFKITGKNNQTIQIEYPKKGFNLF
jgi:hypothetical protein